MSARKFIMLSLATAFLVAFCSSAFAQSMKTGECETNKRQIKQLIDNFEKAQMKGSAKGVLELFTHPYSKEEKDTLSFLLGEDAAGYRLYSTGKTNFIQPAYVVLEGPVTVDSYCVTIVIEWRRYYPHGVGGNFGEGELYTVYFWTTRSGNKWKVDFYSSASYPTKYGGWDY